MTGCPRYLGETDYVMLTFIMETQGQPNDSVLDCGVVTEQQNSQQL